MKKYSILIALVLVVALAIPTSAAITLNGSVKTTVTYEKKDNKFTPTMTFTITPATVNTADPNKAYVKFEALWSGSIDWLSNDTDISMSNTPKVDYTSYMQFKGAYTAGGPEVTTKIGYLGKVLDLYNDSEETARWIPGITDKADGISITGGKIASADLGLYFVRPVANNNYFVATLKKDQLTNRLAYRHNDEKYRYTLDVNKYPLTSNVKLYGYVDYNQFASAGNEQAWKVGAELKAAEDATFDGYYRYDDTYDVNGTFNLDAGALKPVVKVGYKDVIISNAHKEGIYASAIADVAEGFKLGAKYDDTVKTVNLVAGNMYSEIDHFVDRTANPADTNTGQLELGSGYGAVLTLVDGGTTAKTLNAGITQDLVKLLNLPTSAKLYARAGAKMNLSNSTNETWGQLYGQTDITTIPGFSKITVHGRVHVSSNTADNKYGLGATYTAPNGVAFKAGYDWKLGKGYDNVKEYVAKDAGFIIDASKTISF